MASRASVSPELDTSPGRSLALYLELLLAACNRISFKDNQSGLVVIKSLGGPALSCCHAVTCIISIPTRTQGGDTISNLNHQLPLTLFEFQSNDALPFFSRRSLMPGSPGAVGDPAGWCEPVVPVTIVSPQPVADLSLTQTIHTSQSKYFNVKCALPCMLCMHFNNPQIKLRSLQC